MYVELPREEEAVIVELVRARIRELGPEIRRCRDHKYALQLKADLHTLQRLLQRLHESEWEVT